MAKINPSQINLSGEEHLFERFMFSNDGIEVVDDRINSEKETPKQNMNLDGFTTTKDLDLQLESILKSIEPEVMAAIKKIVPK